MDPQALIARARAAFTAHRPAVLLSGAGVAAVLGYRHYQAGGPRPGAAGAAAADPTTGDPTGATIAGYNPAGATGAAGYDSSANDIYNALQPQIEQTQTMLEQLLAKLPLPGVGTPKPAGTPPRRKPPKRKPPRKGHKPPRKPTRKPPRKPKRKPIPRDRTPTTRPHAPAHKPGGKAPTHHKPPRAPHRTGHKAPPPGTIATRRGASLPTAHRAGAAPAPVRRA